MKLDDIKTRIPSNKLNKILDMPSAPTTLNVFNEQIRGEYYFIDILNLTPYGKQARKNFDNESIVTLANTIKEHGIRQPLTVIKSQNNTDKFEIISGERRFLAAKSLGLKKIPCIIIDNYKKAEEIALIENIQRENLNPLELGFAYDSLYKSGFYNTQAEIAEKLGVPRTQISEYIKYTEFSQEILNLLKEYKIKERLFLRKLLNLDNDIERMKIIETRYKSKNNKFDKNVSNKTNKNIFSVYFKGDEVEIKKPDLSSFTKIQKEIIIKSLKNWLNEID
ncbi:MAG: ParB/RepB/Spo0J family partition protein [Nitrosopumilus sp.]|nr:ParB/RepB/Spo0J family partition protein [Nitrosopumilus sp.]